jgi:hypothetical protein
MASSFSLKALRSLFYAGGAVATVGGLHSVVAGARSLPAQQPANSSLESELRYYAAFYVAFGLLVLRTASRADSDTAAVRALAGALFLGGLSRAGGWATVGRPHMLQRILLAFELGLPPVMIAWQWRIRRRLRPA